MALYRCAACGSPKVMEDTQTGGVQYNYVKGAIGTAVLGVGGAVAGISNETQKVYKCPDCGLTMTYPMLEEIKILIDAGVSSIEARNALTLYGVNMPWEYFTGKYRNIESGLADELLKIREETRATIKKIRSETLRDIADDILKDIRALRAEVALMDTDADDWKVRQSIWEVASKENVAMRAKEYEEAERKLLIQAREEKEKRKGELTNKIEQAKRSDEIVCAEKQALMEERTGLGLFKGKRKREIEQRLQEIEATLSDSSAEQGAAEYEIECLDEEFEKTTRKKIINAKAEIDKKYPVGKSPADHRAKLEKTRDFFNKAKTMSFTEKSKNALKFIVYKFIEHELYGPTMRIAFSKLIDEFDANDEFIRCPSGDVAEVYRHLVPELMDLFDASETCVHWANDRDDILVHQQLSATLRYLEEDGVIATEDFKRFRYYYIKH